MAVLVVLKVSAAGAQAWGPGDEFSCGSYEEARRMVHTDAASPHPDHPLWDENGEPIPDPEKPLKPTNKPREKPTNKPREKPTNKPREKAVKVVPDKEVRG